MPPKLKRKSSFNSRKGATVGPPQKRHRLKVQYDTSLPDKKRKYRGADKKRVNYYGNTNTCDSSAILIRAHDTRDFEKQIVSGIFKFTRMKTIKAEVAANCPIYIYNPEKKDIAGPYAMEIPTTQNEWSRCLQIVMSENHVLMRNIIRYIPNHLDRGDQQTYDSRPRIVCLKKKHSELMKELDENILSNLSETLPEV